ncbi:MAG: hypothetical protein H7138_05820, partial [Myxococcales bacterium]|nr:hypothetical protein [Myxococcales bacterium]
MTALDELARAAGLDPAYRSWRGDAVRSSDESLIAALRTLAPDLGVTFESADDAPAATRALERQRWLEVVPPVVVAWNGELIVPFTVPAAIDEVWELEVVTEAGRTIAGRGTLFTLPAEHHTDVDGVVHCVRSVRVVLGGELGYHTLRWQAGRQRGEALILAAP